MRGKSNGRLLKPKLVAALLQRAILSHTHNCDGSQRTTCMGLTSINSEAKDSVMAGNAPSGRHYGPPHLMLSTFCIPYHTVHMIHKAQRPSEFFTPQKIAPASPLFLSASEAQEWKANAAHQLKQKHLHTVKTGGCVTNPSQRYCAHSWQLQKSSTLALMQRGFHTVNSQTPALLWSRWQWQGQIAHVGCPGSLSSQKFLAIADSLAMAFFMAVSVKISTKMDNAQPEV